MIGIIGAAGAIGKECTKLLNNYGIKPIKLGIRNNTDVYNKHVNITSFFDLEDDLSFNFVDDCDVLINCSYCTEPTILNFINKLLGYKLKIIDLNYYKFKKPVNLEDNILFYGIGSSPGLMEYLPKFGASFFDRINNISIDYLTSGKFSYSAAKQYLEYLENDEFYPKTIFKDGELTSCTIENIEEKIKIFDNIWYKFPYMDTRTLKICKLINPNIANFNICIKDGVMKKYLENIKVDEVDLKEKAKKMACLSDVDCFKNDKTCGFILNVKGSYKEKNGELSVVLKSSTPERMTALTTVATTLLVQEHSYENESRNYFDMSDILINNSLLKKMKEIDTSFFYQISDKEIDYKNYFKSGDI